MRGMAAWPGRAELVEPLLAELEAERASLAAPAAYGLPASINVESLRPTIEARVIEMREAFAGAPDAKRAAFRALLGERRLRVFADGERDGFRVEGLFELPLETQWRSARLDSPFGAPRGACGTQVAATAGLMRLGALLAPTGVPSACGS